MSIRWLVCPIIRNKYWEYIIPSNSAQANWIKRDAPYFENISDMWIAIPTRAHKDRALLLLSLGMTKEEIEQTLKESE